MASPRTLRAPNVSATPFSGWPSKRSRKISDQATVKPEFAGRSGEIARPWPRAARPRRRRSPAAASSRRRAPARSRAPRPRAARPGFEKQPPVLVPARPAVPQRQPHAHRIQPAQPGAQQRRGFHGHWKHPAAGADEGLLAQRVAPVAQGVRRKRFDGRRRAAAAPRGSERGIAGSGSLWVRLSPPRPGHQELAAGGRHARRTP